MENKQAGIFRGQSKNPYKEVATRGEETLGISIGVISDPSTDTMGLILRFVAFAPEGVKVGGFSNLSKRGYGRYYKHGHTDWFKGTQLNKLAIPVLKPVLSDEEFLKLCEEHHVWGLLSDWVMSLVQAEGFELINPDGLTELLRYLTHDPEHEPSVKEVSLVLTLPDLKTTNIPVGKGKIEGVQDYDSDEADGEEEEEEED